MVHPVAEVLVVHLRQRQPGQPAEADLISLDAPLSQAQWELRQLVLLGLCYQLPVQAAGHPTGHQGHPVLMVAVVADRPAEHLEISRLVTVVFVLVVAVLQAGQAGW
jgi:hypothetical protein